MLTNILWTGREYHSLENCVLTRSATGSQIDSTIVGFYAEKIYKVEYSIETDAGWATTLLKLNTLLSGHTESLSLSSDGKGNWTTDGHSVNEYEGCVDVDISVTPFTNTLPINRLNLALQEGREIRVLYLDVLNRRVKPVTQKYTRLSQTEYRYENVPNDFEALITVDQLGLVVDYPQLFARTAISRQG